MHWTYESYKQESDFRQGDILDTQKELQDIFSEVHPYFLHKKYRGFLILTQSCDMVRRKSSGGKCSATHIILSVIRSLEDIISPTRCA